MAALSSGLGYGVSVISCILWVMGDKVAGEGPLIQLKGGSYEKNEQMISCQQEGT